MAARVFLYDAPAIMHQYMQDVGEKLGDLKFIASERYEKFLPGGLLSRLLADSIECCPVSSDYIGETLGNLGQQII